MLEQLLEISKTSQLYTASQSATARLRVVQATRVGTATVLEISKTIPRFVLSMRLERQRVRQIYGRPSKPSFTKVTHTKAGTPGLRSLWDTKKMKIVREGACARNA